jgi:cysteinyl-tRNA synthetase
VIRLYDTLAREKREFTPADPKRITMYVCGPTVYGRAHIGNARPAVVFDVLARLIRHHYGADSLVYARNVTDVDDKIIAAAEAAGVGYRRITELYYKHYMEDMAALNVIPPSFEPRATGFIDRMIAMIERLILLEHAYVAQGHVLFSVPSYSKYGELSRRDREALIAGARIEVAPYKRDPSDFVLWKPAGESAEQVALSFDSPWGRGRPGWHIECSAMIEAFADSRGKGDTIDIHGGGLDLIFPHHENEIAQSRCAHHGAPLARYWVHNGFVDMGADKMSKSLGNIVTPGELLKTNRGETLRLALLSAHYRQPLPWSEGLVAQAKATLDGLYRKAGDAEPGAADEGVLEALGDDLNTPLALARLGQIDDPAVLKASAALLGLLVQSADDWMKGRILRPPLLVNESIIFPPTITSQISERQVEQRISERTAAKAARDFATADRIRDELKAEGILLEDGPEGTTWRRA